MGDFCSIDRTPIEMRKTQTRKASEKYFGLSFISSIPMQSSNLHTLIEAVSMLTQLY